MQFYDVSNYDELPPAPAGCRYYDFISEPKGLRCYVVPEDLPRGRFLEEYEHLLDKRLQPIYKHNGICVRQDSSFFVPAFYIVHPVASVTALDKLDPVINLRTFFIVREIRKAMRDILGVNHIHMYYHEKLHKSGDVHYSLLPLYNISHKDILLKFNLLSYVKSFDFQAEKDRILEYNNKMRAHLLEIDLLGQDNLLTDKLSYMAAELI